LQIKLIRTRKRKELVEEEEAIIIDRDAYDREAKKLIGIRKSTSRPMIFDRDLRALLLLFFFYFKSSPEPAAGPGFSRDIDPAILIQKY
jgi:hypothetical protein